MILIFGGAYQGKLDYAKKMFKIRTVCDCSNGTEPDFAADAICGIDGFVKHCVYSDCMHPQEASDLPQAVSEAADWFSARRDALQDKILIMSDVSQGIVPIEPELRAFREMNGRLMLYLAKEADEVHRVFCGLGKRVK